MSMLQVATGGHVDICGPSCHQGPCLGPFSYCSCGHIDVCGPYYYRRPCKYQWSVLPPEAMLMYVGHATAGCHVDVNSWTTT